MATRNNINLQDSLSPLMEQLTFFHNHVMSIIMMMTSVVGYVMISMNKSEHFIQQYDKYRSVGSVLGFPTG